jgi:hypothetical protein
MAVIVLNFLAMNLIARMCSYFQLACPCRVSIASAVGLALFQSASAITVSFADLDVGPTNSITRGDVWVDVAPNRQIASTTGFGIGGVGVGPNTEFNRRFEYAPGVMDPFWTTHASDPGATVHVNGILTGLTFLPTARAYLNGELVDVSVSFPLSIIFPMAPSTFSMVPGFGPQSFVDGRPFTMANPEQWYGPVASVNFGLFHMGTGPFYHNDGGFRYTHLSDHVVYEFGISLLSVDYLPTSASAVPDSTSTGLLAVSGLAALMGFARRRSCV